MCCITIRFVSRTDPSISWLQVSRQIYISVSHFYRTWRLDLIEQGLCIYVPVFHNKCVQVTQKPFTSFHNMVALLGKGLTAHVSRNSCFLWTLVNVDEHSCKTWHHTRKHLGTLQVVSFLVFGVSSARKPSKTASLELWCHFWHTCVHPWHY